MVQLIEGNHIIILLNNFKSMKNKFLAVSIIVIISTFMVSAYAIGQNNGAKTTNQVQQQEQTANHAGVGQIQEQNKGQSTSTEGRGNQEQNQEQNEEQNEEQNQESIGKVNAEQHRSTVANFVQGLLRVADEEKEMGQQVRVIAQQQNQSASTTIQAMEKIQKRSKIKTFFFGSDYKNLGTLRSEMVQTRNRLEELDGLMEDVQNEGEKIELQNQVQMLEQEQTKIESFIKAEENQFSLFGWLLRLFNK